MSDFPLNPLPELAVELSKKEWWAVDEAALIVAAKLAPLGYDVKEVTDLVNVMVTLRSIGYLVDDNVNIFKVKLNDAYRC